MTISIIAIVLGMALGSVGTIAFLKPEKPNSYIRIVVGIWLDMFDRIPNFIFFGIVGIVGGIAGLWLIGVALGLIAVGLQFIAG